MMCDNVVECIEHKQVIATWKVIFLIHIEDHFRLFPSFSGSLRDLSFYSDNNHSCFGLSICRKLFPTFLSHFSELCDLILQCL